MALTLSNLCKNTEDKYGLKLIAGTAGTENIVRWVHMVEDTEVPEFLHGNELVFTTGIANHKKDWLLNFVKNLKKSNAAGVVINIGPYISAIPPQVIVYCEQNNFPLLTIPWETRIIDISYTFCRLIINDEKQEQSLTEAFKNLILNPSDKNGYENTLEKAGFSNLNKYTVTAINFLENEKNVTETFFQENETRLNNMLTINSLPKVMFLWNKNLILVHQNLAISSLKADIEKIEKNVEKKELYSMRSGFSDSAKNFVAISELFKQSQSALMFCEIYKKKQISYNELGVSKILLDVQRKDSLKDFYENNLRALIDYDNEHSSDLYLTLRRYCENNGSVFEMANKSGVHRNTVNYKMKKIKEILKRDFTYKTIMDLMLCFSISDIINNKT